MAYNGAGGIGGSVVGSKNTIENCCNEGEIKGAGNTGGIAGTGISIDIKNCKNIGKVSSVSNGSGGIIGYPRAGIVNIINCSNEAVIGEESTNSAGGIAGCYIGCNYNDNYILNIYNCYSKGSISSNVLWGGGILGIQGLTASTIGLDIQNCYSIGEISGIYPGGIVGRVSASDSRTTATQTIKNSYYLENTATKGIYSGTCTEEEDIEALREEYMKSEQFLADLNTNSQWGKWKKEEDGYPVLEFEN